MADCEAAVLVESSNTLHHRSYEWRTQMIFPCCWSGTKWTCLAVKWRLRMEWSMPKPTICPTLRHLPRLDRVWTMPSTPWCGKSSAMWVPVVFVLLGWPLVNEYMSVVNCLFDLSGTVYEVFLLPFLLLILCSPLPLCPQLLHPFPVISLLSAWSHHFLLQRERKNDALAEKKKKKKNRCRML